MKIVRLDAENVKRLKVVAIEPDGSVVQITGKNGSGKTSVLDAIFWALAGERNIDEKPIREGEQKARVRLDLGDLIVTRKWTASGTVVLVETAEGAKYPSPQKMLDAMLGALTFDPLAFARATKAQQADTLRDLVGLKELDKFDAERAEKFSERTEVNRKVKSLTERVNALDAEIDKTMDVTPVDVKSLLDQIGQAAKKNSERQDLIREFNEQDDQLRRYDDDIAEAEKEIADWTARLSELQSRRNGHLTAIATRPSLPEVVDTALLTQQVQEAQAVNAQRQKQADVREIRNRVAAELTAAKSESDILTDQMAEIEGQKLARIAEARFPVDGLSIDPETGGVTFNGIPLEQASSAEQLRVSVALAMAANPKLRVIRIQDGSLLDDDNLAAIAAMADERGYQVWIEKVDTSGKVGVYLEDGAVAAVNGVAVEETEPAAV